MAKAPSRKKPHKEDPPDIPAGRKDGKPPRIGDAGRKLPTRKDK